MKVLYVSRTANGHDARFIEAWESQGAQVVVHTVAVGETEPTSLSRPGLEAAIRQASPDVVQAGPIVDVGHDVAALWSGPLILTSWGFDLMDEVDRSDAHRMRAVTAIAAADVLLTDNRMVTRRAVSLGMDAAGVVEFPWGIELDRFGPRGDNLRASLGWNDAHWIVGCTRRHEVYYDVATVVAGFADFARARPEARLLLAGSGSLSPSLRTQVRELGIESTTVFLGEVDHARLADVYRTLDAYVSASTVDGTSVSLLEAMACEVPVCVSEIPGNAQWVTPDTGLTFPVGNAAALSRALDATRLGQTGTGRRIHDNVSCSRALVEDAADWAITRTRFPELGALALARHESRQRVR